MWAALTRDDDCDDADSDTWLGPAPVKRWPGLKKDPRKADAVATARAAERYGLEVLVGIIEWCWDSGDCNDWKPAWKRPASLFRFDRCDNLDRNADNWEGWRAPPTRTATTGSGSYLDMLSEMAREFEERDRLLEAGAK